MNACEKTRVGVWHGNIYREKERPSAGFGVSGGRRFGDQIAWQAKHFGSLSCRFRGRRSTIAGRLRDRRAQRGHGRVANPIGTDVQNGMCRFRGRRSTTLRALIDRYVDRQLDR